jgi:hypothetical protein
MAGGETCDKKDSSRRQQQQRQLVVWRDLAICCYDNNTAHGCITQLRNADVAGAYMLMPTDANCNATG